MPRSALHQHTPCRKSLCTLPSFLDPCTLRRRRGVAVTPLPSQLRLRSDDRTAGVPVERSSLGSCRVRGSQAPGRVRPEVVVEPLAVLENPAGGDATDRILLESGEPPR